MNEFLYNYFVLLLFSAAVSLNNLPYLV
jgi:hypothetical protein